MPRTSVLMTLFDRPTREFQNVLHQLRKNDLTGTEIIIVDDGSTKDYSRIRSYIDQHEMPVKWVRLEKEDYPDYTYYIGENYNNPALAWNTALDNAEGEIIVLMGSDILLPVGALKRAKTPARGVWCCGIVDIDTSTEFLGRSRVAPYGWFMSWNRMFHDVRWDLEYLRGMAYDDNDFSARLALSAKSVDIDLSCTAYHQSHPPTAYSDGHKGHDINERYTWKKWGGIPWDGCETDPLEVTMNMRNRLHHLHVEPKKRAKVANDS
jgi:glycosyltransferase involved in cell wall biosynthesis